ncbi:ArsR/SmtB family transcription factor [Dongia soli]|uniref:Helix-turn-helix transcriptional regulator n=1 Tax=Dongia soli TaxID=600628 RepID=A0ABU5EAS5_9PROT|nr:helix-turn-helix transcriptional regulator [Dongia soli]MDY0882997.1 helix-turn-helix transcriptional regulator [Dongia soli]
MIWTTNMAEIAALIGDTARANMLTALMDGRALTAGELAYLAGISASTASGHLAKLTDANLLSLVKQGRHRYFRLASPLVGNMLENLMAVAAIEGPKRYRPASPRDEALRRARTCFNHLAGRLGVAIADAMIAQQHILLDDDAGILTESGIAMFDAWGVNLTALRKQRRIFCKPCLDWSERRPHLGGAVGAGIAARCFDLGWIDRVRDSRAIHITSAGAAGLQAQFGISLD